MSGAVPSAVAMHGSHDASSRGQEVREPLVALLVGGLAALLAFELCALLLGPVTGLAIAVVAAIAALIRREFLSFALFAAASALSAMALTLTTPLLLAAAIAFATGLAVLARTRPPRTRPPRA